MTANLSEGSQFLTGGAILGGGVSHAVGGMGLAGGFGAVSLGAVPVVGAGIITGAAAYGVFKGIAEGDGAVFAATGIGVAGGIGVSTTVGGMGLVGGFGGIGIGMGTMAIAGGVVGLGIYGIAKMLDSSGSETPSQIFSRMEEKIESQEFYLQALAELAQLDPKLAEREWDRKFSQPEIDDELELLKAKIASKSPEVTKNPINPDSSYNPTKTIPGRNIDSDTPRSPKSSQGVLQVAKTVESNSWKCVRTIKVAGNLIYGLAISADDKSIAVATDNSTVLFNLQTGRRVFTFFGQFGGVYTAAISPNGRTIASGGFDAKVTCWQLDTKQLLYTCFDRALSLKVGNTCSHMGAIEAIAYSPDGKIIASASADKTLKIWQTYSGECKTTLRGHQESILCLTMSPDGKVFASGSRDRTIRVWDLMTYRQIRILSDNSGEVNAIAISPDGQILASGGTDRGVKLWDMGSGRHVANLTGCASGVKSVAISPDGKWLASGNLNLVEVWNLNTRRLISAIEGTSPVAFSRDSKTLVTAGEGSYLKIWSLDNNSPELRCEQFKGKKWYEILSVDLNADAKEVKRAYLKLARLYHPDLNESNDAKLQMQLINLAYARFCQNQ